LALVGADSDLRMWQSVLELRNSAPTRSMVTTQRFAEPDTTPASPQHSIEPQIDDDVVVPSKRHRTERHDEALASVVAIRCTASSNLALIATRGRVVLDDEGTPTDREAGSIQAGDTVLLMRGANSLSPAEEFVELLVRNVRERWP